MKRSTLSIVIIAGNEEGVIGDCLKSCFFADEVIVVHNSTDNTPVISKTVLKNVILVNNPQSLDRFDFSQARNLGFNHVNSDWVLYVDADERITLALKNEIIKTINQPHPKFTNYDLPRANFFLGHRVKHGGTYPDYVKRLFRKDCFRGYINQLHEQPQVDGNSSVIKNDLLHFTHRNIESMLDKSNQWTSLEAKMLFNSKHPPVVWWRFIRMMFTKFIERYISQQMWRDGIIGLISSIFESFDTYMIYAKLWELQQSHNRG